MKIIESHMRIKKIIEFLELKSRIKTILKIQALLFYQNVQWFWGVCFIFPVWICALPFWLRGAKHLTFFLSERFWLMRHFVTTLKELLRTRLSLKGIFRRDFRPLYSQNVYLGPIWMASKRIAKFFDYLPSDSFFSRKNNDHYFFGQTN